MSQGTASNVPNADSRRVAIVANPYSGALQNRQRVEALAEALVARGWQPQLLWHPEELAAASQRADFASEYRCLVSAGGDGTLNRVINCTRAIPLAMFPLGNENLFARQFGHTRDVHRMSAMIDAGRTRTIDLARAQDRNWAIMTSAGFDAEVVHRFTRWREAGAKLKRVRNRSYVGPILAALWQYVPTSLVLVADGTRIPGVMALVFNLPQYGARMRFIQDARDDDGLLDWIVFQRPGRWQLLRYAWAVRRGKHLAMQGVHHGRARHLRIECDAPVPLEIDGEAAGFAPLEIEVLPRALSVVVP